MSHAFRGAVRRSVASNSQIKRLTPMLVGLALAVFTLAVRGIKLKRANPLRVSPCRFYAGNALRLIS